uniref:Solute carrier family 15 member 2-like n=1 Tax=Saccoglossus kowalevskii TaxID=10224 RepID=A0ABM0MGU5_SACKO|nr:PREDICTED: solute carrier family 15 member 2-like [Saccoglossus kowalevskii]
MKNLIKAGRIYERIDENFDSGSPLVSGQGNVVDVTSVTVEEKKDIIGKESCFVRYPSSIYFILGNEFCERYSYYGMKAILVLYFTEILLLNRATATSLYHTFTLLCYLMPIFGAMIADGWWGKYKWGPAIALLLIAIGTGGIKPCVSAFGGDQFRKDQVQEIQVFFSIFYFAINCGSLLSTFITPILREDVQCFGNDCYSLAFGIPAVLLFIAILLFIVGRYTVGYKEYPSHGNIVWRVCKAIGRAIKNKIIYGKERKFEHWLDYASDKYDARLIEDTKCMLHVLIMYIPLPLFWALFDQQGSTWTLQATQMNGQLGDSQVTVKPDQMQVLNPFLILLLIPIFDNIIYPLLRYCNFRCTHLQRMSCGMLFACLAFVCSGVIQIYVNEGVRIPPTSSQSGVTVINAAPCGIGLQQTHGSLDSLYVPYKKVPDKHEKPERGLAYASFVLALTMPGPPKDSYLIKIQGKDKDHHSKFNVTRVDDTSHFYVSKWDLYEPDVYRVCIYMNDSYCQPNGKISFLNGAVYTIVFQLSNDPNSATGMMVLHETVPANTVSVFWQIPQYVLITTGEVMFSITGLEFSYAQAPASMKSCLQACWLLTVCFGNLIVVLVAGAQFFSNQATQFFFFAGLMLVVFFIFVVMSFWYKYATPSHYDDIHDDDDRLKLGDHIEEDTADALSLTDTEGKKED